MKKYLFQISAAMLFLLAAASAAYSQELCREQAQTTEGPVLGAKNALYPACEYKGIPYAAPPTGAMRWKAPSPPAKHAELLSALKFGPSCAQNESFTGGGKSDSLSEDCLSLNIFRPAKSGTFPVMFWIHGGGYTQGAGSYDIYDGAHLAGTRDVVVVTINYRLGAFGFLALPELANEDKNRSTGNYGILDTIAALAWVRDNIKSFGGDPNNVTIFGESAGGVSVCVLLASKPAAGLFHHAIIESGACDLVSTLDKGFESAKDLAAKVGCPEKDPLSCLRAKPANEILQTKIGAGGVHIDGYVLLAKPIDLIKKGEFNKAPVLVGSNKDEFNMMMLLMPGAMFASKKQVTKNVKDALGARADEVLKLYSFADYRKPIFLVGAVFADGFGSRAFSAAEELSSKTPVFWYRFDWQDERWGSTLGAFHGLELPLVFGTLDAKKSALKLALTTKAKKSAAPLSEKMMSYWTNFAKTGDPNGSGLPAWPKYSAASRERIYLKKETAAAALTTKELERYQYFASVSMEELGWGDQNKKKK